MKKSKFVLKNEVKKIVGFQFRNDFEKEKLPCVILSHGFMANQKMCKKYAMHLAEKGFVSFTYDFVGGGLGIKSSGKMCDMTVFTEVADCKDVISYVKTLDYVDSDNITLLGCSQGGFVSALTAVDLPEVVKRLVLFYPAFCIPDDARAGKMIFAKFDPANIPEKIQCGPVKIGRGFPATVLDMDVNKAISAYTGPVCIIHGTGDKLVNYSYSVDAQAAYQNASLVPIEGGDHGFRGADDEKAIEAMDKFLGV